MEPARREAWVAIELDSKWWPIVVTRLPPVLTEELLAAYFKKVEDLHESKERFASLVDTAPMSGVPAATVRKRMTEFQKDHLREIRSNTVCTAVVLPSSLLRGVMKALQWVVPPPEPQRAVANLDAGVRYCVQELERERIELGAELRRYLGR